MSDASVADVLADGRHRSFADGFHGTTERTYSNRYEIKYLVEARRLPQIDLHLRDFLAADQNGNAGGYYNCSIYFDSPEYHFYREKHEGNLVRIKPRIRFYRPTLSAAPQVIYLELKGRYDRIVTKRRALIDRELAEALLSNGPIDLNGHVDDSSALAEFLYLANRFRLAPSVTVQYHRTAFHGAFYPDLRITYDRVIQCSLSTDVTLPEHAFIDAIPANWMIIEVKYNEKIPELLLNRIHSLDLQQSTFSKYAVSLEKVLSHCHSSLAN